MDRTGQEPRLTVRPNRLLCGSGPICSKAGRNLATLHGSRANLFAARRPICSIPTPVASGPVPVFESSPFVLVVDLVFGGGGFAGQVSDASRWSFPQGLMAGTTGLQSPGLSVVGMVICGFVIPGRFLASALYHLSYSPFRIPQIASACAYKPAQYVIGFLWAKLEGPLRPLIQNWTVVKRSSLTIDYIARTFRACERAKRIRAQLLKFQEEYRLYLISFEACRS